jgi:cytochrome c-type biogenesis protein CcmH/NrfG
MSLLAARPRSPARTSHAVRALGALLLLAAAAPPGRAQAAQASPPGASAHATARAAAARREWTAAAAAMEQAVRAAPTNAEYHYWLGKAYAEQARSGSLWARARLARRVLDAWERTLALDSTYDAAYQELIPTYAQLPGFLGGSPARAEALLDRWQRIHPYAAGLARVRFDVARDLPQQTVTDAEALARAFPDSARALAELATAYLGVGRAADAEATLARGLMREPEHPHLLLAVGRAAAETGDALPRGESALRTLLARTSPADTSAGALRAGAQLRLGQILERRGDRAGARTAFEAALAVAPKSRAAREGLARVR